MNVDTTTTALRLRRELTGETFNDGTVTAWTEALRAWTPAQVKTALIAAAREHNRVAIRHVVEQLPPRDPPRHLDRCATCDGTRWVPRPGSAPSDNVVMRCPDCSSGTTTRPAAPDQPADPAYVDSLLAELARRRANGTAHEPDWAFAFYEAWHGEPMAR